MLNLDNCRERQQRLLKVMEQDSIDLAVITNPKTVYYFSGVLVNPTLPHAYLLDASGKSALLTDAPVLDPGKKPNAAAGKVEMYRFHSMERDNTVTNWSQDVAAMLKAAAQLDASELERFISELLALRARRSISDLSREESVLLQQINKGLPPDVQQRYDTLRNKLSEETIAPDEHQELIALNDQIEEADAERVKALTDLAQLRNISITELMDELGILPPSYA